MTNALADAKSPYLRGHADNPVDWREWSDEALAFARREGRPLFVSVGYSACHWCHVMAREAFSDAGIARFLNDNFVSIKVDREERPDLDQVLQIAHQALNQRGGGWPLSVFLEPDGLTPFFAGTYFPLHSRYGMPGFTQVLERILGAYREQGEAVREQGERLQQMLTERLGTDVATEATVTDAPARAGHAALLSEFDAVHGGFGAAPKFPQTPSLAFLCSCGDEDALRLTLAAMARGGLYDHVGGGFFRYTVDEAWRVPHFEKMLADNAQLLALYAEAAIAFDSDEFRQTALATARFMEAELGLEGGGYASSLNAEAGGEEGGFYIWDREEVQRILGDERYPAFADAFGLNAAPQVEGRWHLALTGEVNDDFEPELTRLAEARAPRIRPERDDKRLTGLNALAATALARAGLLLDAPDLIAKAGEVFKTLVDTVIRDDEVFACVLDSEAYQSGFLADHACLAEAALALASVREGDAEVALAIKLADVILERFRTEGGGLALTPANAETLLYRPRDYADNAVPSGAGTAVRVFIALGHLLAEPKYLDAAEGVLRAAWIDAERAPVAHPTLFIALDEFLNPPPLAVLRGDERIIEWAALAARTNCRARILQLGSESNSPSLERYIVQGDAVAYVCQGTTCSAPIVNAKILIDALRRPHD